MNTKKIARILVKRPKTVLLIFTILTVIFAIQIQNIYMTSDFSSYLPQDDPTIELWEQINKEFKVGSTIIIIVDQTERYYDITHPEVLNEMDRVGRFINKFSYDQGESDDIVSVRSLAALIREENAKPKPVVTGGLGVNEIPDDQNIISSYYMVRPTVEATEGVLFTNNHKYAVIIVQLSEDADYDEVMEKVEMAVNNEGNDVTNMRITGTVAMQKAIQQDSMQNLVILFPIALAFVSLVIFFFHRSVKGILIAFLPPAFAIMLTFGVLGIVQPELTIISVAIVALLLGLGVDYSIHLMNRLAEEQSIEDMMARVDKTLKSTGKAILLSTITTMIGFGSLMISSMSPMVTFGFGCAIGILFCFISAIILVPCLVVIFKFDKKGKLPNWKKFAEFTIKYRHRIIVVAVFFVVMSLILIPKIETDVNYMDMSPRGLPEVESMYLYSDVFGGGANFNALIVETDPQGLADMDTLQHLYEMEEEIRNSTDKYGVRVSSIAGPIAELTDYFNVLLEKNMLIEKLMNFTKLLKGIDFESFETIIFNTIAEENFVNDDFSKTVVVIQIPVGKSIKETEEIVNVVNDIAEDTRLPNNGRISQLTGQDAVNVAVNKKLADEQTQSMIIALILVLAALIIIFNSSMYGFLTMIPVAFILMWEPGFLVGLDIPLSVVTISIASIMIGIGIDYGVHITQRVREEIEKGLSKQEATREAIEKTGISLVEAALTTMAGLISIYFVNVPSLQEFGIVVIIMTGLSLIAAALILPVFFCSKVTKL